MDAEGIKIKMMTVSLGSSLASEGIFVFVDLWEAKASSRGTHNEIVVS